MSIFLWIAVGAFIFFLLNLKFGWVKFLQFGKFSKGPRQPDTWDIASKLPYTATTPAGCKVFGKLDSTAWRYVDAGIDATRLNVLYALESGEFNDKDGKPRFTKEQINSFLDPAKMEVAILPSELSPRDKVPGFRVYITDKDPRWGTEFDQGGYMLAAGQYIPNTMRPNLMAIADPQESKHYGYLQTTVKHETEHVADTGFNQWRYVQSGGAHNHPLYRSAPDAVSFVSEKEFSIILR